MTNLENLIKSGEATIVDVRTHAEFKGWHLVRSINIPLQEIPKRIHELKNIKNIVLCCATDNRSDYAAIFLRQNGIECENAGSWMNIKYYC